VLEEGAMIKLSLFQLDPMTAYERYRKEVLALEQQIHKVQQERNHARKQLKDCKVDFKEEKRQYLCQIEAAKRKGDGE
jgi:tRNA-binding EMAP/Myf-like protein